MNSPKRKINEGEMSGDDFVNNSKKNKNENKENVKCFENNVQSQNNVVSSPRHTTLGFVNGCVENSTVVDMVNSALNCKNNKASIDSTVLKDLGNKEFVLISDDDEKSVSDDDKISSDCLDKMDHYHGTLFKSTGMIRKLPLPSGDSSETESLSADNPENEAEVSKIKYLREVHRLIQDIKSNGEESIGDEATELPALPGLYIKNHGYVSLPLWGESAEKVIRVCTQAPYGLNDQTLIDTSVRDTYQINPGEFEIRNPQWGSSLKELVKRVATGLGCTNRIEAKLYKLLLYKEGGHFKKHRDTEKEKQMFGTLILQLPSVHEGGELVVYHKNGSNLHDFGQKTQRAPYHPQFVAHYADVEHEILPVKSGYRLALVYSLCWVDGNGDYGLNDQENILDKLSSCLMFFSESDDCCAIKLNHKYTASSLEANGVKALKGIDNDRFNLLKNANSRLSSDKEMSFFIARAFMTIFSYDTSYNGYDWEESDRTSEIDEWYSVSGQKFNISGVSINLFAHIIDPDSKSRKPFAKLEDESRWGDSDIEEDIEEYTGNENATKTTTYHKYLLVFLPKKFEISTFLKVNTDIAVSLIYNHYLKENTDCTTNLDALVKKVIEKSSKSYCCDNRLSDTSIHNIIEMCCKFKTFEILKSFLIYKKSISSDDMILIIRSFSLSLLQETLKDVLLPVTLQNIDYNCKLVQALIEMKDEKMAVECFMFCVDPILNESTEFIKQVGQLESMFTITMRPEELKEKKLFKLATTIILLNQVIDNSLVSIAMNKFIANMKLADQKLLQKVLELFIKMDSLESSSHLIDLFVFRSAYLAAKIEEGAPKFSWSMPGSIPGHPKVDSFFRSELQTFKYTGIFNGIQHARNFSRKHENVSYRFNHSTGYSATFVPNGIGKHAHVLITKTKNYFESLSFEHMSYGKMYEEINRFIENLHSSRHAKS